MTGIALDAGYEAPDSFARAFRRSLGQSPSAFREEPDWSAWARVMVPLAEARNRIMQQTLRIEDVTIAEEAQTPIGYMAHRGEPQRLGETIRRFIAWRKETGARSRPCDLHDLPCRSGYGAARALPRRSGGDHPALTDGGGRRCRAWQHSRRSLRGVAGGGQQR